jgi:hypothetical protein
MPSLKDLKNRINSVKSTKKITSAMKMVAGAPLSIRESKSRPNWSVPIRKLAPGPSKRAV